MRDYLTKLKNKNISLDLLIHFFAFISILLIGADKWGFDIGVNIRIDQFFLVLFSALLFLKKDSTVHFNLFLCSFLLFSLLSVFFAFNIIRSIVFYFSFIYNTVFIFISFYNYIKIYGINTFLKLFRLSCYCQVFLFLLQFILKTFFEFEFSFLPTYGEYLGVKRFSLWFYEPSYFATYFLFWLALSCTMVFFGKNLSFVKDIIVDLVILCLSTSSSGFIGIAVTFFIVYFIWLCKGISWKKLSLLAIPICLFLILKFALPSVYNVFIMRLFNTDLNTASGGRIAGWKETFDVFIENFLLGVGPGNYGLYLGKGTEIVPTNVTLELFATVGIFAALSFILLNVSLIIKCLKKYKKNPENIVILAFGLALLVFLIILQFNQGYLRLYHWMFLGVIEGLLFEKPKLYKA